MPAGVKSVAKMASKESKSFEPMLPLPFSSGLYGYSMMMGGAGSVWAARGCNRPAPNKGAANKAMRRLRRMRSGLV
jgi:hypothetical protein